jgi:hypothetical protein
MKPLLKKERLIQIGRRLRTEKNYGLAKVNPRKQPQKYYAFTNAVDKQQNQEYS